jgi:rubredoxin
MRHPAKITFYFKNISAHSMEALAARPMRTYMCLICGFIYDEAAGLPEEGIPPGTRWEDVPVNWVCPECGARKEDFELVEV